MITYHAMHQSEIACVIQRAVILTKSVLPPGTLRLLRTMLLPSLMVQPLEALKRSLQHQGATCKTRLAQSHCTLKAVRPNNIARFQTEFVTLTRILFRFFPM
ncbi:hypothetical protein NDU88_005979 [Pleurodeles waltl]|uniref:Uncharacterized protein n=1 Tax=Pleurodeles waltl TaxID=8319 RepID=A0AAV7UJR9_PLEWA|nr:hypothetical protein NDU88_005979 [Pleurodeles waltl]